jgi:hypothetical protein
MHIPGDVEIGGIFGIHDVSTVDPYICGALRTVNGFQFSAAIMYAINQINALCTSACTCGFECCTVKTRWKLWLLIYLIR